MCTALAPISISRLASSGDFLDKSECDQVWLPIVCPAWATCLSSSGCHMACLPIGKNVALMQCAASAARLPKESPILIRLFKEEAELEVWKQDDGGRFALLATYPICRWSGELGRKFAAGRPP